MSDTVSFKDFVNPKTPEHIDHTIKQVFWILVIMAVSTAWSTIMTVWVMLNTGIDEVGSIPGTGMTSLSEIFDAQLVEVAVLIFAIILFRWKKSLIAAIVILIIAAWRVFNVINVYLLTDGASPSLPRMLLNPLYLALAVLGVLATYRWWRLRSAGQV